MRKLFTLLMMAVLAFGASATDIVFDSNPDGGTKGTSTQASAADQMTKDGVTISCTAAAFGVTGTAENTYAYRFAKNSTTTITSTRKITKIVFTCIPKVGSNSYGSDGFDAASTSGLSLSDDQTTATWTGDATEVQLVAKNHQVRAPKIVVTVEGEEGVSAPKFSMAAGTYYKPISVEITTSTTGATIKYALNGGAEQTYSSAITISENTTLTAYAEKDGKKSTTTEAVYEFATATAVANIAAYKAVEDGTQVIFQNPVTVLAQYNKNIFAQDATGQMLIFGSTGQTYKNGDVIPAGFTGKKTTYNGEPELSVYETDGFQPAASNSPVEPEIAQSVDIDASYFGKLVLMQNVTIANINKSNFTISDGAGQVPGYNSMGAKLPTEEEAAATTYNVTGIVGSYRTKDAETTTYQVLPITIKDVNAGEDDGDMNIAKFNTLADGTEVTFDKSITVLGQKGSYLYTKDATGYMLVYGSVGQTYKMGDVIPAGFSGLKKNYAGEQELASPKDFQASTENVTVTPETLTASAVNHDNWGKYVLLKDVTVDPTAKTITDASGSAPYYDRFTVDIPTDGGKHDLYAIVGSYGKTSTVYQLFPIQFTGGTPITTPEVATLDKAIGAAGKVKLTGDLTAIYQNGKYLYVKDATATTMIYGDLGKTYKNGDKIAGGIEFTWNASYAELVPVDASQFTDGVAGTPVQPEVITLEEISQDMVNQYVRVKEVESIVKEEKDKTYTIDDRTITMTLYNRFDGIEVPQDGKEYAINGFVSVYKSTIQLYPTFFDDGSGVEDINSDKIVKGVKYFNLLGVEANEPFAGINVVVTTYEDGSKKATKIVK